VYRTSFDDAAELQDWSLEGGKRISLEGGNLVLESDDASQKSESDANHLVCWLKREIPGDFYLEFTVHPANRNQGLNIVFFNARGIDGQSIFDPSLKPRNGIFAEYT